jgi:hypothetical protein
MVTNNKNNKITIVLMCIIHIFLKAQMELLKNFKILINVISMIHFRKMELHNHFKIIIKILMQ